MKCGMSVRDYKGGGGRGGVKESRCTFALGAVHAESTPASTEIPAISIDTLGHGVVTSVRIVGTTLIHILFTSVT